MSSITATHVTSVPACPSWCGQPNGHEYDMDDTIARNESRFHRLDYQELEFAVCDVRVSIEAWELRSTVDGNVRLDLPEVCIELETAGILARMSADEAHALADQLHTAAVEVDRIGGAR